MLWCCAARGMALGLAFDVMLPILNHPCSTEPGGMCPGPASYKTYRPRGLAARPIALGVKHVALLQNTHEDCLPLLRHFIRHIIWVSPFLSGRHARSVLTKVTEIVPQFLARGLMCEQLFTRL